MTMNISPDLMLTVGAVAAGLFIGVLIIAAVITARNRRIIRRHGRAQAADERLRS